MGIYTVRKLNKSGTMCIILPKESGWKVGDTIPLKDAMNKEKVLTIEDVRFIARDEAEKAIEEARHA